MKAGVVRETFPRERRVALVPLALPALTRAGMEVWVEKGAGERAGFSDADYVEKGAKLADNREQVFAEAEAILQVRSLGANPDAGRSDLSLLRPGQVVIGLMEPWSEPESVRLLAERGVTAFALELIPRITRAQSRDVLSSMANIAGYKAVLLAANMLPRLFPMMMTAAGTISPARVFVIARALRGSRRSLPRNGWCGRAGVRRAHGGQGAGAKPGGEVRRVRPGRFGHGRPGGYARELTEEQNAASRN
jgi:NAD(P) transhydrogenase subunit alpha